MLYTVLGLYEPAELALDTRLARSTNSVCPLTPRLCAQRGKLSAQADAGPLRDRSDAGPARHPLLMAVCAEDDRLRV